MIQPPGPARRPLPAGLHGALAVSSIASLRPPAPRAVTAPADQFSAARAAAHLAVVAARTHVAGSPANDAVRDDL
jgi:hypothetical protein